VDPAGETIVHPDETTIYILRATNEAGIDVKTATVTVEGIPPVLPSIDSFGANPAVFPAGEESTLYWEVSGAANVTIDGIGEVDPAGETIVHPDETTIYVLRATNEAGLSDIETVTVTVENGGSEQAVPNQAPNTPIQPSGTSYCLVGESYTYSTSATDADGDSIMYIFDWGGKYPTSTKEYTPSGAQSSTPHRWGVEPGTYGVKVKAVDSEGAESGWSDPLNVTVVENTS